MIPIGRHSLMNGISIPTDRGDAALGASFDQLLTFFARTTDIGDWGRQVVLSNLAVIGVQVGSDAPLDKYLKEVSRSGLTPEAAFGRLLASAFKPAEAERWIRLCEQAASDEPPA